MENIVPINDENNNENLPVVEDNRFENVGNEEVKTDEISENLDMALPKKVDKRLSNPHLFKKGQSGNPKGKPPGTKNYNTLFDLALKEIAKKNGIPLKMAETRLIAKGLSSAFQGDYNFYRDALDRRFGKARESIDISGGALPIIMEITRGQDRTPEPEEPEFDVQQKEQEQNPE